ncbi:MAG: NAD-glutamate dehydrogenase [Rhizobiales bacterium]|nr:NAD-glutamate dehydrogenase [Hyphomicrobiales bacterium]
MIDYEQIRDQRLAEAEAKLTAKNAAKGAFVRGLFDHALAEDLARYDSDALASFAEVTFAAMAKRKPGQPTIEMKTHRAVVIADDGTRSHITAIDIINDNMPFLIDSVVPELRDLGYEIDLIVHPIFSVERSTDGTLAKPAVLFKTDRHIQGARESVMHIHITAVSVPEQRRIKEALSSLLKEVRGVVKDWPQMTERLQATIRNYKGSPPPIEVQQLAEAVQFLEWLLENNYTFLGAREYRYDDSADRFVQPIKASGLGILKDPNVHVLKRGDQLVEITPEIREFMIRPDPLIISKANVRSRIHRRVHMDYIGVKLYDAMGKITGELRFVGLFTSTVYAYSINAIPYLRHKAQRVMEASGFDANSHSGKALWSVLESYPRDELFQIGVNQLQDFALAILALDGRAKVRVLPRWDRFDRYVSVLVFLPRDRYNTDVRIRIGEYLCSVFKGTVSAFYPGFPEGLLARVHFIIRRKKGERPTIARSDLERKIAKIVETWEDGLAAAMNSCNSADECHSYVKAFSAAYREAFAPENAVHDIKSLGKLADPGRIEAEFYRRSDMVNARIGLKLFQLDAPIELSTRVPMLEFMGFRVINERTYKIDPQGHNVRYLHDMTLETSSGKQIDLDEAKERLEAMLLAIWQDQTGNDGYNALAVTAGLNWRDVAMLRTVSRYMQQIGVAYSQEYMWQAMNRNAPVAASLVALFHARFDPKIKARDKAQTAILQQIETALDAVSNLDEDQIIRRFRDIIMGSVRTNFFKRDATSAPFTEVSLKLAPRTIDGIPEPRPFREIFMTSPRLEGLHLRFGKVARGGLRWSDRPEDFRTEVLGLVKAQQVKNAVIVPVGSKGGFVPKKLSPGMSRDEYLSEGTAAYKIFVSNLLELTDNLDGDRVIHPKDVVRHEGDDPYLVVAADKGTATFSDIANGISQSYDFWLDDAFASGGSAGYDHKKMGITARGGWEAVKRHFREMDKDIQTEPFTVAGVGDMSGDVFGNAMLLSRATKLVAAFDHRDIFIDPNPDCDASFAERQRIFSLGRSSWQDYDQSLISKGGGIFPRSLKSIALTPEIQAMLGVKKAAMSPFELMQAILKMNVELFWFGGIGTYIRGPNETNADVGDRANDPIRIEASEVGAKVIGEGANLGMTQRARIAYNRRGGRSNSDAIDNSAGVNSSDVEVNIKIALGAAVRAGALTIPERNKLLVAMTDEVAALVLRNNYQQTLSISITQRAGMSDFDDQTRTMQALEARGLLNRRVEVLPDNQTLGERRASGEPLTRAEIGVIFAYAKIVLFDDLLESTMPDDPYLARELVRYFPEKMQKKYASEIAGHKLRREIIATQVSNAMINRGGATYLERIRQEVVADPAAIAQAYIVVRDAFDMQALNACLDQLDTKVRGAVQLELYALLRQILINQTVWVLRNTTFAKGIAPEVEKIAAGIRTLSPKIVAMLPRYMKTAYEKRRKHYQKSGVPDAIAHDFAVLPVLDLVPNIIGISDMTKRPLAEGAAAYFALDDLFLISRIDTLAADVAANDYYDGLAISRGRAQLARAHAEMTREVLVNQPGSGAVGTWQNANRKAVDEARRVIDGILSGNSLSVAKLSVAANLLEELARRR